MESLKAILNELEKSVQCSLCLESLKSPVTTRCDHNFCNECIRKVLKGKVTIPCPLCNKVIKQRSLKKAAHLQSLIPLVHTIKQKVRDDADIPRTPSQSDSKVKATTEDLRIADTFVPDLGCLLKNNNYSLPKTHSPVLGTVKSPQVTDDEIAPHSGREPSKYDATSFDSQIGIGHEKENGCRDQSIMNQTCSFQTDSSLQNSDPHNMIETFVISVDVHQSTTPHGEPCGVGNNPLKTKGNPPSANWSNPPKFITNGSAISPSQGSKIHSAGVTELQEDAYAFPVSQDTVVTNETKRKKLTKKNGRGFHESSSRITAKRKLSENNKPRSKRRRKSPKTLQDAETEAANAREFLAEVDKHVLVVEKVPLQSQREPALAEKSPAKPAKKTMQKNEERIKKTTIGPIENSQSSRRLLSTSSSSESEDQNSPSKRVLTNEHCSQQSIKDKVSNWLETASPATLSDIQTSPSIPNDRPEMISDDDLVSHSQVSIEHLPDRVIVLKRRKFSSPVKLDAHVQESVRSQLWSRDAAVFGTGKPKNTFLSRKRRSLSGVLWPAECSISGDDVAVKSDSGISKKPFYSDRVVLGGRENKSRSLFSEKDGCADSKCIYDVIGLSQGVSPFGTPKKQEQTANSSNVNIDPTQEVATVVTASRGPDQLKEAIDEIVSLRESENYEIEDGDDTEIQPKECDPGINTADTAYGSKQVTETDSDGHDKILRHRPVNDVREDLKADEAWSQSTDTKDPCRIGPKEMLSQGQNMPKNPDGRSCKTGLPSLGESPSVHISLEPTKPRTIHPATSIELGLLDFSEPLHVTGIENNKFAECSRPEAVAETCRLVLQNLGQLTGVQNMKKASQNIGTEVLNDRALNGKDPIEEVAETPNEKHEILSGGFETDDSVVPPSTSTANFEIPTSPAQCDLEKIPIQFEFMEGGCTQSVTSESTECNGQRISKSPDVLGIERDLIAQLANVGKFPSNDNCTETPQFSHNDGWNKSDLWSERRDKNGEMLEQNGDCLPTSNSLLVESASITHIHSGNVEPPVNKTTGTRPQRMDNDAECSTEVTQDSDKVSKSAEEISETAAVRKSSRRNKGQRTTFDYCKNMKKEKALLEQPKNGSKPVCNNSNLNDNISVNTGPSEPNVVLQHLQEAFAEAQIDPFWENMHRREDDCKTTRKNKKYPRGQKADSQPLCNVKEKLVEAHPRKKLVTRVKHKVQTGKRTKQNKVTTKPFSGEGTGIESSPDGGRSDQSSLMKTRGQRIFPCSQFDGLPKHFTDVSVRLIRCKKISDNVQKIADSDETVSAMDSEDIDASPMLFETQEESERAVWRSTAPRNETGRSISIDLSRPFQPIDGKEKDTEEVDFIQDNVEFVEDETDDVICCSWNEVEKESRAASFYEDCSSNASELNSGQGKKSKSLSEEGIDDEDKISKLVDSEAVIPMFKEIASLDKSSLLNYFPRSVQILSQAIDCCKEAVSSMEGEVSERKEQSTKQSENQNVDMELNCKQQQITKPEDSKLNLLRNGRMVRETTRNTMNDKQSTSIPINQNNSNNDNIGRTEISICLEKAMEDVEVVMYGTAENYEMKEWSPSKRQQTNEHGSSMPRDVEANHMNDTIEFTGGILQQGVRIDKSVGVSANVDAWLQRLSDLNQKKGEELQPLKDKIDDRWTKIMSNDSPVKYSPKSVVSMNSALEKPKKTMKTLSDDLNRHQHASSEIHDFRLEKGPMLKEAITSEKNSKIGSFGRVMNAKCKKTPLHTISLANISTGNTMHQTPNETDIVGKILAEALPPLSFTAENRHNNSHDDAARKDDENSICDNSVHNTGPNTAAVQQWLQTAQPGFASPPTVDSSYKPKIGFVTTGLQEKDVRMVKAFANQYSGQFYPKFENDKVTHVIVRATHQRSCDRTLKYLQGIAGKKWVVSFKWVFNSMECGKMLPEIDYEILGDNCMREFDSESSDIPKGPMRSRISNANFKLLKGYRCVCLPPYTLITSEQASELMRLCGANLVYHLGDLIDRDDVKAKCPEQPLIIMDSDSSSDVPDFTAMADQFGATVISIEWVYESISRFEVQPLDDFMITCFTEDSEITPTKFI